MRSLVPIPLIFLAATLAGCAENHSPPGTFPAPSYVATSDGQPFAMTRLVGNPSDAAHEGCGGR